MQYDPRYVRRDGAGHKTIGGRDLCEACGARYDCDRRIAAQSTITSCGEFVPVITFKTSQGLETTFNTFRRGAGLYNRVELGMRVRMFVDGCVEGMFTWGKVVEKHVGELGPLLDDHAAMNHLFKYEPERRNAVPGLQKTLIKMYGRNYAGPASKFSVIYVEPDEEDPLAFAMPD